MWTQYGWVPDNVLNPLQPLTREGGDTVQYDPFGRPYDPSVYQFNPTTGSLEYIQGYQQPTSVYSGGGTNNPYGSWDSQQIVGDLSAYNRTGGQEGAVSIAPDATPYFGFGDSAKNYNAGLFPNSGMFVSTDPNEINDYQSHRQDVVNRGVAEVGALVGGTALAGALSGGGSALTPGSGTASVSGSYASPGVVGGSSDLGALISGGMGPQAALAGGGAGAAGGAAMAASPWLTGLNIGSSVLGGVLAKQAGDAGVDASREAIAESGRQFDTTRGDLLPTIQLGQQAAGQLAKYNSGDMSGFFTSPGYQFNLAEGQKAIDRSLAARGMALSGAGVKEGIRYASGMASNESGAFVDRLLASAGLGTTGAATSANAGANHAALTANAGQAGANARASGYAGINNAITGGIQNQLLMRYLGGH